MQEHTHAPIVFRCIQRRMFRRHGLWMSVIPIRHKVGSHKDDGADNGKDKYYFKCGFDDSEEIAAFYQWRLRRKLNRATAVNIIGNSEKIMLLANTKSLHKSVLNRNIISGADHDRGSFVSLRRSIQNCGTAVKRR